MGCYFDLTEAAHNDWYIDAFPKIASELIARTGGADRSDVPHVVPLATRTRTLCTSTVKDFNSVSGSRKASQAT